MERRGVSYLPLHYGKPPENLYRKMIILIGEICTLISQIYSPKELVKRFSDPIWFQSLSLVTGFDWNSSGTTTTTIHALKEYTETKDSDFFVSGGKGKSMKLKSKEIRERSQIMNSDSIAQNLIKETDYIARIDSNLLQDGYDLYIHSVISDYKGNYSVIQQGLNSDQRMARRYHWSNLEKMEPLEEQRNGISSQAMGEKSLDLTSSLNRRIRENMLRVIREKPNIVRDNQYTLDNFSGSPVLNLSMKVPFDKLREIYEYEPSSVMDLISFPGVGKSTVRAIAYISEVITGEKISMEDPIRYSYALGGKDGIPKPVDHRDYDMVIEFFKEVLRTYGMNRTLMEEKIMKLSRFSSDQTELTIRRN
ncbi:DUF763 domain-containing protein [Cuniculiplasma sp. SKW3]|uniref:DUF763 domain-containing protein n=1 Tax=Cuniculiplasma sp. SKW3 TaxID=3400170 RepID=UPI003FD45AA8